LDVERLHLVPSPPGSCRNWAGRHQHGPGGRAGPGLRASSETRGKPPQRHHLSPSTTYRSPSRRRYEEQYDCAFGLIATVDL